MTEQDVTRDHTIARANGGPNWQSNLTAAHDTCNRQKAARYGASESYITMRRRQVLRSIGIYAAWPETPWRKREQPNFGLDPDGERLRAPQYGIT